ncbi:iron-containing alcohol dehydrogenase [Humitalea sp. 24SJ18S-53]|uniref:iron-containing alcohol dehydrogenase n=1 Tax=Humitalea sp. 24SJ18S-53 TaxID=3422307 RepID=UPI003D66E405
MTNLLHPIEIDRPARIAFGPGLVGTIGTWAAEKGITRSLVIADAFNAARVDLLGLPGEVTVFGDVKPEPDIPNLDSALALAERVKPQLVVGFGGGSAMDMAKLVAVLPGSGQTLLEVVGPEKVLGRRVALAQVATTSGTGSEAGSRALVTDPATQNKVAVQSRHMIADLAVIDPDLTLTVPRGVTAATGVDALAHCAEAFTSRKANPVIDLYALEGIRLVGRFLARAVADGGDREARAGLALASLYGGFCLGPVNTTAGHAVAYPLGTRHHVPHGLACAVIFPHTLAFNAPAVPEKTALILEALGLGGAGDVLAASHGYCAALGIEMKLSGLRVPESDLATMAEEAHAIRRLLDNNPREMSREQILAIYHAAL